MEEVREFCDTKCRYQRCVCVLHDLKVVERWNSSNQTKVYGDRQRAKAVGQILTNGQLFLQPPLKDFKRLAYDNPQYLRIPKAIEPELIQLEESAPQEILNHEWTSITEVEALLDDLTQPDFLREITIDHRIITKLDRYCSMRR